MKQTNITSVAIDELCQEDMASFFKPKVTKEIAETKTFKIIQDRLDKLKETSDYITFPEISTIVREGLFEKDESFPIHGQDGLMKVLALGTPEYMADSGIVLLGSAFTYPEQFRDREYQPDAPEDKDGDFYPGNALIIELYAIDKDGWSKARVYWFNLFGRQFPRSTYITREERVEFKGTWDEAVDHYVVLVKRMEKLAKGAMAEGGLARQFG